MSDLTAKFAALEEQLSAADAALQTDLNAIRDNLDLLNTAIDTLNNNGATNTRYLLQAIAQNSPCAPCPTPPISVPPVDGTTNPIDQDKCKRVQAFLLAMTKIFGVLDVMSAFSVPFQPNLILDAVNQVIADLGNGDTTPTISFPESVQLVGDGINYVAGNLLVGDTLAELFAAQVLSLRDAMYSASTPAAAKVAYASVINGSSIPSYAKPLMVDAAYNALFSYYLDPASDPNLSGLSGTVCGVLPGTCYHFSSTAVTSEYGPATVVVDTAPLAGETQGHYDTGQVFTGDYEGWVITRTSGELYVQVDGIGNIFVTTTYVIGSTPNFFPNGVAAFEFDLCSPEE